jgi:hypothetical protein
MRAHDRAHLAELFDKENTTDGVIGVSLLDPVAAPLRMVERGPLVDGHKHRAGAAVEYFAGLDVSLEETAIFIIDDAGLIVREAGTAVGLEACSLTLAASGTDRSGYCGNCIETRQAKAAIGAMPNKTDRNDARGIAQIMRTRK